VKHGAVEFVVIGFGGTQIDPALAPALLEQVERGTIRIIDLLFLQKDADGAVRSFEIDEIDAAHPHAAFSGIAQSMDGLIAPADVIDISNDMPAETTVLIVLFEHLWLRDLRNAVERSGGQLMLDERIPGEIVDAVADVAARAG
jgi:Family of unknown function (DUF6325)